MRCIAAVDAEFIRDIQNECQLWPIADSGHSAVYEIVAMPTNLSSLRALRCRTPFHPPPAYRARGGTMIWTSGAAMRGSRTVWDAWQARRIAGRRARNLRRGQAPHAAPPMPGTPARFVLPRWRMPRPAEWVAAVGVFGAIVGAVVIAGHARHLSVAAGALGAVDGVYAADALQATLPGAAFTVSSTPGIVLEQRGGAASVHLGRPARHSLV
jgi:hypothetical protein